MKRNSLLIVLLIIYILSPVDLVPGPIDDAALALLGIASTKSNSVH